MTNTNDSVHCYSTTTANQSNAIRELLRINIAGQEQGDAHDAEAMRLWQMILNKRETVGDFARLLQGINLNALYGDLLRFGYVTKVRGQYRVTPELVGIEFREQRNARTGTYRIYALPAGKALLTNMWSAGLFTMKVGFGGQR